MDTNTAANGGADALEDGCPLKDEETVIDINEYVDLLEAEELQADIILGGDEGKECTYPRGYLSRQAVFSCITCCPDGNAGVCTACSLHCHDGHEVIEIWTRRHFRCDCGNSKFGIETCKLFSSKDLENTENIYNKNYKGVYCICNRPSPDPDSTEDMGEMLQCCICEDWFHEAHLGLAPTTEEGPHDEDGEPTFDELICQGCAPSVDFISEYTSLIVPIKQSINSSKEQRPVEVVPVSTLLSAVGTIEGSVEDSKGNGLVQGAPQLCESQSFVEIEALQAEHLNSLKTNDPVIHDNGISQSKLECSKCCKRLSGEASRLPSNDGDGSVRACTELQNGFSGERANKPLFLSKNWRTQLCRCDACIKLYLEKNVSFLLNLDDSFSKYEEVAKEKRKEKLDASSGKDLSFLDGLSHVGKIEFLHGLNDMTSELSAFLASRESGKAITSADIYEVFENMKKKRSRLE